MGANAVSCLLEGKSNVVMCVQDGKMTYADINYALVLDRMYKGKLQDGDLEKFSSAEIEQMKSFCDYRRARMERIYRMSFDIGV
jgi:6-phosphofructokinase